MSNTQLDDILWQAINMAKDPHDRSNKFHSMPDVRQAILQWFADTIVGDTSPAWKKPKEATRNELKMGMLAILKQHGWKEGK